MLFTFEHIWYSSNILDECSWTLQDYNLKYVNYSCFIQILFEYEVTNQESFDIVMEVIIRIYALKEHIT